MSKPQEYVLKPQTITAIKYTGDNWKECIEFCGEGSYKKEIPNVDPIIMTWSGDIVLIGNFIVNDSKFTKMLILRERDFNSRYQLYNGS